MTRAAAASLPTQSQLSGFQCMIYLQCVGRPGAVTVTAASVRHSFAHSPQPQPCESVQPDVTTAACVSFWKLCNHFRPGISEIYLVSDLRQFNHSKLIMYIVEARNSNPSVLPSTAVALPATRWTKSRSRRNRGSFNLTADLPFCDYEGEFKICAVHYLTVCSYVASTAPVCKEATSGETAPIAFNQPPLPKRSSIIPFELPPLPEKSSIIPVPVEVLQTRPSESSRRRVGVCPPQNRRSNPSPTIAVNTEREHALASASAAIPCRLQVTTPASLKPVFADDSA
jgi:hypothetical protein